ncbi:TPA: hypothetical protein ACIBE3_004335, partial [Salmonella enterica subsp. enterica serovar Reading]
YVPGKVRLVYRKQYDGSEQHQYHTEWTGKGIFLPRYHCLFSGGVQLQTGILFTVVRIFFSQKYQEK